MDSVPARQGNFQRPADRDAIQMLWRHCHKGRPHVDDSALNLVSGEVGSLVQVGNRVRVRVGPLTAEVTGASAERLELARGGTVFASFKATGTRLVPL